MVFKIKERLNLPVSRVSFPVLDGWDVVSKGTLLGLEEHSLYARNFIITAWKPESPELSAMVGAAIYEGPIDPSLDHEEIVRQRIECEQKRCGDSYKEFERSKYLVCDEKASFSSYKFCVRGNWVVNHQWVWIDRDSKSELSLLISCMLNDIVRHGSMIMNFSALLKKE